MNKKDAALFFFLAIGFIVPSLYAGTLSVKITDDKGNALPDAVVYLSSNQPFTNSVDNVINIEQKNKAFLPFVSIAQAGTMGYFPNRDGIGHHVYSFSPAKTFQLPLSEDEYSEAIQFDKPGVVTVGCNIHDWMVAYIYIVNTPYYSKTDTSGTATITDIPAGDYQLHLWHPGGKSNTEEQQSITIPDNAVTQHDFSMAIKPVYFWRPQQREEEEY